jgi:hypothetical protein
MTAGGAAQQARLKPAPEHCSANGDQDNARQYHHGEMHEQHQNKTRSDHQQTRHDGARCRTPWERCAAMGTIHGDLRRLALLTKIKRRKNNHINPGPTMKRTMLTG